MVVLRRASVLLGEDRLSTAKARWGSIRSTRFPFRDKPFGRRGVEGRRDSVQGLRGGTPAQLTGRALSD